MWKPLLIEQETELQFIGLFCSMSLFLVFWSNYHGMASIRQGVLIRERRPIQTLKRRGGGGVDNRRLYAWWRLLDHKLISMLSFDVSISGSIFKTKQ